MKAISNYYTGRRARIGSICFDDRDRMCIFVDYCPSCNSKCVLSLEDAKQFANKYGQEKESTTFKKLMKARIRLDI